MKLEQIKKLNFEYLEIEKLKLLKKTINLQKHYLEKKNIKIKEIEPIEKLNFGDSKFLKIKLIKNKIYKKNHYLENIKIEDIEIRIKKALYVIYLYHMQNKKILFVGSCLDMYKDMKKLLKHTKHTIIPELGWIPGVITNQRSSFKSLFKKQKNNELNLSKKLLKLKEKADLIVIFDQNKDENALYEGYLSHVPVISLNSSLNIFDNYSSYKIPGNFLSKKKIENNFFYSLIEATIKKSTITFNSDSLFFSSLNLNYKSNILKKLKKPIKENKKRFNKNNKRNKKKY